MQARQSHLAEIWKPCGGTTVVKQLIGLTTQRHRALNVLSSLSHEKLDIICDQRSLRP